VCLRPPKNFGHESDPGAVCGFGLGRQRPIATGNFDHEEQLNMKGILLESPVPEGKPYRDAVGYTIRAYQATDAARLACLYKRSVLHYGPQAYSADQVRVWAGTVCAEKIAARSIDGRFVVVAADVADNILGWGDLEADGHINFLYSAPEACGRRVGSTLYGALEQHARARSMPRLFVEASELAKHLFTRRGFVFLRRNDLTVEGIAIHNFSMEKRLL